MADKMTDVQVRAELQQIAPDFFGNFDNTDWDAFFEMAEDHEHFERFAVLYAESQKALGEIYNQGHNDDCIFCGLKDKIAKAHYKGGL